MSEQPRQSRGRAVSPHLWVATTYFAEGFPYSVVNTLAEALFKEFGASLQAIGLTALFHLPWNLKFLWGPFLDRFATKRAWLVWTEAALTAVLVLLSIFSGLHAVLAVASIFFVILAFLAATHDIAIDGFYLEGLDPSGQSKFVGYRVMAYRVAMLVVGGPLLVLAGRVGWGLGFLVTAVLMGLLFLFHAFGLPRIEKPGKPIAALLRAALTFRVLAAGLVLAAAILGVRAIVAAGAAQAFWKRLGQSHPALGKLSSGDWIGVGFLVVLVVLLASLGRLKRWIGSRESFYASAFVDFLAQKHVGRILAFVVLFRCGESFLLKMRYAFFRDLGMTMEQIGFASGTVGLIASFTATLLGGHLIAKHGLRRWIWPFVLMQNVLNLLYMGLAWHHDRLLAAGAGHVGLGLMTAVVTVEAFGAGLGTSVFMVYLMRCCRPAFKAAHMAIVTALMSLTFTLAGVGSGFLAEWLGYTLYFGFTFLATIPAMGMIFLVPYIDGPPAQV